MSHDLPVLGRSQQRQVLRNFSRALDREAHNLLQWPDLTWQQMANRLQWSPDPVSTVLASEIARRADSPTPWLRLKTPLNESASLRGTVGSHAHLIADCAISPDGSFIASASHDQTVVIWDTVRRTERATLRGHTDWVSSVAISPDGKIVASGGHDRTVRI